MNNSHQVISDFNCIDLSMPLKEDYFHSIDPLFTGQISINPAAKTICNFFKKLCNKNISKLDIAHVDKSICFEIQNAMNSEEEATLILKNL